MHKLINTKTKEETLCEKVTIDGFDYYVNHDIKGHLGWNYNYCLQKLDNLPSNYVKHSTEWNCCRKVIATNNINIDIPKVVDEIDVIVNKLDTPENLDQFSFDEGFKAGYNKSQETHPFSEDDVRFMLFESFKASQEGYEITSDEIIKICQEHRPKIVYYG